MNLAVRAERNGVAWVMAYRWFRAGLLPVPARKGTADSRERSGCRDCPAWADGGVYARVSSADQKADLDRRVARVTAWARVEQIPVDKVVTEVGLALNGHRRKFVALLRELVAHCTQLEERLQVYATVINVLSLEKEAANRTVQVPISTHGVSGTDDLAEAVFRFA